MEQFDTLSDIARYCSRRLLSASGKDFQEDSLSLSITLLRRMKKASLLPLKMLPVAEAKKS